MDDLTTQDLADRVTGPVLRREDGGYEAAVFAWNVAVQHRPDLVLEAEDADDVAAAVTWARERGVPVAVQATGHGATAAVTSGLLISTRRLQSVDVDADARTARVGAGVQWRTLLERTVPLGLIGLNGSSTDVGIVGYSLGGGLPVLGRVYGFASDRIRSIEVVPPDGVLRTVDAEHEPELFEVLRGGQGNFGVVTAITLELLPVDTFYGGGVFYPGEDAEEVLTGFRRWVADLPDTACPSVSLLRLPDMEFVPEPLRARLVVHVRFAALVDQEEGDRLMAPMRALSRPIMDLVGPLGYDRVDLVFMDPQDPLPFEQGGALLSAFDDAAQAALLGAAGPATDSPLTMVELRPLGGALGRPSPTRDVVAGRDAAWSLSALGLLAPPIAERIPAAVATVLDAVRPWATGGTLVNFHGRPGDATDRARAWTAAGFEVVARAKRRYDPANMMRFGHAVLLPEERPAAQALPL